MEAIGLTGPIIVTNSVNPTTTGNQQLDSLIDHLVKKFPEGITTENVATMILTAMQFVEAVKHVNGETKKHLVITSLQRIVDCTDAGSVEPFDPVIKMMIPSLIDSFVSVDNGKIKIAPKWAFLKACCPCGSQSGSD